MSLARYTVKKADFPAAIKYIQGKSFKNASPSWAVKNKEFLQVVDGKVRFNNLPIIPTEEAEKYLRGLVFDKGSKSPLSRDGMYNHIKSKVAGISRRRVMQFLRGQSVIVKGKGAEPVPKLAGKPLKTYHVEFDLIFLKKNDVKKANKHFRDDRGLDGEPEKGKNPGLTYIVSTVEKVTGLVRLAWTKTKEARVVSPIVARHLKEIASALKTPLKQIDISSDKGTEFSQAMLEKLVKSYKRVPTGSSVEKKNSDVQRVLFQMLRARRGKTIPGLIQLTQDILNNNINRITKKTANEAVEQEEKKQDISNYNKKRAVGGKDRTQLNIGDHVRLRILKVQKEKGLAYKSYKNMLWSAQVYKITGKTKKQPSKYRVARKWRLKSMLLKSAPVDEKSEKIIQSRTDKSEGRKQAAKVAKIKEIERRNKAMEAEKKKRREARKAERKAKRLNPGRRSARRGRSKALALEKKELEWDELLGPMSD